MLQILICATSAKKLKTSQKIEISATASEAGLRVDKFIAGLDEISSRSYAQNLIEKKLVLVNDKTCKASLILKLGDVVKIELPEVTSTDLVPYDFKLDILHEDRDLLVVNKPSGMVVHPAAGHQHDTLVNALLHHTRDLSMKNELRPGIVHRIDKETSGLLVVAKNDAAHEHLAAQFKNKSAHRIYYALVSGLVPRASGTIQSYLSRHPTDRKRYASVRESNKIITAFDPNFSAGKWAITHFTKLHQTKDMSYLKLKLETGRTHQIRVHLSELGHPLVGDLAYGYSVKKRNELGILRFFLHAAELGFHHPRDEHFVSFKTDWPTSDRKKLIELGFQYDSFTDK